MNMRVHANLRLPQKRAGMHNLALLPQSQQIWGGTRQQDQTSVFEDPMQIHAEYQNLLEKCEDDLHYLYGKNVNLEYISSWREFMYCCEYFYNQYLITGLLNYQEMTINLDYMKEELRKLSMLREYIDTHALP